MGHRNNVRPHRHLYATVINQNLQHRKTTSGLKTHSKILKIIFLWDLDPKLLFEIFYSGELFSGGFQFVARVIYERSAARRGSDAASRVPQWATVSTDHHDDYQ